MGLIKKMITSGLTSSLSQFTCGKPRRASAGRSLVERRIRKGGRALAMRASPTVRIQDAADLFDSKRL